MRPGDIVPGWQDGSRAVCLVTATSRHKATIAAPWRLVAAALDECCGGSDHPDVEQKAVRSLVDEQRRIRWYSITKADAVLGHGCMADECDGEPGSWCSEGSGKAWVEVLPVRLIDVDVVLDQVAHR